MCENIQIFFRGEPFDFWGAGGGVEDLRKSFLHSLYCKKKHWPVRKKKLRKKILPHPPPKKTNGPPLYDSEYWRVIEACS